MSSVLGQPHATDIGPAEVTGRESGPYSATCGSGSTQRSGVASMMRKNASVPSTANTSGQDCRNCMGQFSHHDQNRK